MRFIGKDSVNIHPHHELEAVAMLTLEKRACQRAIPNGTSLGREIQLKIAKKARMQRKGRVERCFVSKK